MRWSIPTDAIIVSEWNVVPSIPNSSTSIGIANNSRLSPFGSPLFAIAFSLNRFQPQSLHASNEEAFHASSTTLMVGVSSLW
ncbi:MAG: hypothetical protein MR794_02540 [Bacteroidales bacterium]|nr:hypothetical protein [Bacteroidales bacterium]